MFAEVLLEQNRIDDAAYLISYALRLHKSDCSSPNSLEYALARRTLLQLHAEKENWKLLAAEADAIRADFHKDLDLFRQMFGDMPESTPADS